MLLNYIDSLTNIVYKSILGLIVLLFLCTAYTYVVNQGRKSDDPKKRDYRPFAIILAPFTSIFFLSLWLFVLVLRAILFGGFVAIFTILLIALRKPFLFEWWHKFATKIGDPLLRVNTKLIKMATGL